MRAGIRGHVTLAASQSVIFEVERNLERKATRALSAFGDFLSANVFELVVPSEDLELLVARFVEPKDEPIVAGAVAANARFLATYVRRHLLSQAETIFSHWKIVVDTPERILRHHEFGL